MTVDAMGGQKKTAREIQEADADYVPALKGNQETVNEEVETFLDAAVAGREAPRRPGVKLSRAAENLATLRLLALNLLNRDRTKRRGIRGRQLSAGWDRACLLRLLSPKV